MLICFAIHFYFGRPLPWLDNKNTTHRKVLQCVCYPPPAQKGQQSDDCINKQTTGPTVVDLEDNSSKWCESENEHEHIGLQRGRG